MVFVDNRESLAFRDDAVSYYPASGLALRTDGERFARGVLFGALFALPLWLLGIVLGFWLMG